MKKRKYPIGTVIGDFEIIDIENKKIKVRCKICGRIQTLSSISAFTKRTNKHGYICSMILSREYKNGFNSVELKQFHSIWCNMRNRTTNPNYEKWDNYGGRGIKSIEFENFVDFYDAMYETYLKHIEKYGKGNTTLDRINVDGDYCQKNCRWVTWLEQAKNKTSLLDFKAISPNKDIYYGKNLKEFCESQDLNYQSIISGIHNGTKQMRNGWKIIIL